MGAVAALLAACALSSAEERPVSEIITHTGVPETGHTWGYSSPKALYDGERVYAVSLHGPDMYNAHMQLHWRDAAGWHEGAKLEPVYQPATMLLDGAGHINVFCTGPGTRAYHWRSVRPHDVTAFVEVELPQPELFRFGYLGVGTDSRQMALAGLDGGYNLWLVTRASPDAAWSEACRLAEGKTGLPTGNDAACYPIVMPAGEQVHLVYSMCPDGSVHNTYNRVIYACFDPRERRIVRQDMIAESPAGIVTYGLDALRAPDGTVYALYMGHIHAYGDKPEGEDALKGLYLATLPPGGQWTTVRVTDSTGTAQLFLAPDGRLHVIESRYEGARDHVSNDGGQTFRLVEGPIGPGPAGFLYVIKGNSGSVVDGVVRAVQSAANIVDGKLVDYRLEYLEWRPRSDG
ncbi:MAG: hypothetical protein HPY69_04965 [Armatimonadetes bacterium]|nr:hypothetical protein [Armatimonadota bacterium]